MRKLFFRLPAGFSSKMLGMGSEPASSAWKAEVIASIRFTQLDWRRDRDLNLIARYATNVCRLLPLKRKIIVLKFTDIS